MTHEDRSEKDWEPGHAINDYKKCPKCDGTNFEIRNYDLMWHDGAVWCTHCDVFVRSYDAG